MSVPARPPGRLVGGSRSGGGSRRRCRVAAWKSPVLWIPDRPSSLFHVDQLDVENERRVGRNHSAGAALAVAHVGRNDQRALAANLHSRDTHVPALDHAAAAHWKVEWHVAIPRTVELAALVVGLGRVVQPPCVLDNRHLAGGGFRASSLFHIDFLQFLGHGIQLSYSFSRGGGVGGVLAGGEKRPPAGEGHFPKNQRA